MSSRPRRSTFLRVRPLGPASTADQWGARSGSVVSACTPVEAAYGALRDAVLDLRDGWPPEALGVDAPYGSGAEAPGCEAAGCGRDRLHAAVGAYARTLRRDGVGLPAALVAVRATLLQDAALLPPVVSTAVHHEAVQCCLAAYYAH